MSCSNEPFENAHRTFLSTLSTSNRARFQFSTCSSPNEIEKTLRELECLSKQGQKKSLNRCLRVFKKLNERLQPYFDALNVIASAEDNIAFAYGAFRIILQLASAFPTFLEKLIGAIERLADTFPQYDAIVEIFDGHPPVRMRIHLEKVYEDLFCFLNTASRIFTASSGKVKRPVGMIASVIWTPFDSRFNDILNRMDNHRNFIMIELEIHKAEQAHDAELAAALERSNAEKERERAEEDRQKAHNQANSTEDIKQALLKEAKESSIQRILEWLAPPSFVRALEHSQEQREEDTAQWIFEDPAFRNWKTVDVDVKEKVEWDRMPPWVLWVHGNPGCGKTVLASSVIDEIVEGGDWDDKSDRACYFFFKYGDPSSSTIEAAYRSVLAQILHRNRDDSSLLDKFLFARLSFSGQLVATYRELLDLIRVCASSLGQLTLILDGIDESENPDMVCPKLKDLVTTASVKLICFSRPNVNSLQNLVDDDQRVGFDRRANESDIRTFLTNQLCELMRKRRLLSTANISSLVDVLVHGADGMFLWARLMVKYLSCPALSPTSRENTIKSVRFPEGLHQMYDRILLLIHDSSTPDRSLARRVLLWLAHSFPRWTGLSQKLLQPAVSDDDDSQEWDDFTSIVVSVCGGLVEFDKNLQKFQITHLTVREYLEGDPWSRIGLTVPLIPNLSTSSAEMSLRCLRCFHDRSPKVAPTKFSRDFSLSLAYEYKQSFEAYVAGYWGKHLSRTIIHSLYQCDQDSAEFQTHITLVESIKQFLENPLALGFWIESAYKSQRIVVDLLEEIDVWSRWIIELLPKHEIWAKSQEVAERLLVVTGELRILDREWSHKLLGKPSLIWDDVMVFQKVGALSEIAVATNTHPVTVMEPVGPKKDDGKSVQCLCTISRTTNDGKVVGVLSVYSSSDFELFWRTAHHDTAYEEIEKFSTGWIAKYELWSSSTKARLESLEICVPTLEIQLLLRQSVRQDPFQRKDPFNRNSEPDHQSFEISFPVAISQDCLSFAILRTIYNVPPGESAIAGLPQSHVLSLDFLDHFSDKWTANLNVFNPNESGLLPKLFHVSWHDWYSYSTSFSSSGKYLCFTDYQMPEITHLAVFEFFQRPQFSAHLLQWTKVRMERVKETIFHPTLPLLALSSGTSVSIWAFLEETSNPIRLRTQSETFQSIAFSLCGNFLLTTNEKDVDVLPIPECVLAHQQQLSYREGVAHELCGQTTPEYAHASRERPKPTTDCKTLSRNVGSKLPPNGVISEAHLLSIGQGSKPAQGLLLTNINNEVELKLVGQDKTRFHLLSMPMSINTRDTAITIKAPVGGEEKLQIMFNKKAAQGYSLSDGKQAQFPTMVDRQLTSITQISEPTLLRGGNRDVEGPPQKRLRRDGELLRSVVDARGYSSLDPFLCEKVPYEVIEERAYKRGL